MRPRPIAYNLLCGFLGAIRGTPRGINRVDFGLASHLLDEWPGEFFGVLPTPIGMRAFGRQRIIMARDSLSEFWREASDAEDCPVFEEVRDWLIFSSESAKFRTSSAWQLSSVTVFGRISRLLTEGGINFGMPVHGIPEGSIYIDVGHDGIADERFLSWLGKRPDVHPMFMVHDTIPIDYPEIVSVEGRKFHRRVIANATKWARNIITPSKAAAMSLSAHLGSAEAASIQVSAIPLPIDSVFKLGDRSDELERCAAYFVVCGAIEPRKNQQFLLHVWRDLVQSLGDRCPRLIIVGQPGFRSASTMEYLENSDLLKGKVLVASGLSTPALSRLLAGARALLLPSLAEGFGLPPLEAIAVGTPCIVSDIPSHREVLGTCGVFLHSHDAPGWTKAITQMALDVDLFYTARQIASSVPIKRWPQYVGDIDALCHASR